MKSKTSCFSSALFFNTLRRFWPLFAAYPFIWILILPVQLNSKLAGVAVDFSNSAAGELAKRTFTAAAEGILRAAVFYGPLMTAVFAVLFAMASFSCFYNSKSVSAVCALPVKREGLFFSFFMPGPVVMILSNMVVALITFIVQAAYGAECLNQVMQFLGIVTLQGLFFSGFAALCASLTGHILILPCVYVILNFVYAVVALLTVLLFHTFVFGLSWGDNLITGIFSPLAFMLTASAVDYNFDDAGHLLSLNYNLWLYIGICAVIGILLVLAAMRLVKIRRMETAGDVVAFNPLKPVFKYCMCLGSALVLGSWFFYIINGNVGSSQGMNVSLIMLACMAVGALIGYFAAEMLISKTLHVFAAYRWKGFGISLLVIAAVILLMEFDVFGIERRLPKGDDVDSVYIFGSSDAFEIKDPELIDEVIALHGSIVSHKSLYESSSLPRFSSISLIYEMKNGASLSRTYDLPDVEGGDIAAWNSFFNKPEVILLRKNTVANAEGIIFGSSVRYYNTETGTYENLELSAGPSEDLYYNYILKDMEEGNIGLIWLGSQQDENGVNIYDRKFMDCSVEISFTRRSESGVEFSNWDFNTKVTVDSRHTLEWLRKQGIEPVTFEESYRVQDRIGDAAYDLPATSSK